MSTSTAERGRITARVPAYAQDVIEQAAKLTATTTNQFVAQAALREAERVIRESQIIQLSTRDTGTFLAALADPPPANERLAAALLKHLENIKDDSSVPGNSSATTGWQPRPRGL